MLGIRLFVCCVDAGAPATKAARAMVAEVGLQSQEFELHALRIGGATKVCTMIVRSTRPRHGLVAVGMAVAIDSYTVYARNVDKDAAAVGSRWQPGAWYFVG